jgi:hypothetical protein
MVATGISASKRKASRRCEVAASAPIKDQLERGVELRQSAAIRPPAPETAQGAGTSSARLLQASYVLGQYGAIVRLLIPRHPRGNKVDQESGRRAPRVRFRHRQTRLLACVGRKTLAASRRGFGRSGLDRPLWRGMA